MSSSTAIRRTLLGCLMTLAAGYAALSFAQAASTPDEAMSSKQMRWVHFEKGSSSLSRASVPTIQALAREIGSSAIITVAGQADSDPKLAWARTKTLVDAMQTAGIPSNRIIGVVAHTPQRATVISWTIPILKDERPRAQSTIAREGRPLLNQFDILMSDGHLAVTLNRWGQIHGYQVEWATPIQVPVMGELTLDASGFAEAVEQVMSGLRKAGYPLSAQQSGKVIRINSKS